MDELDYYIRDGYTYIFLVEDMKFVESQVKMEFGKKEYVIPKDTDPTRTTLMQMIDKTDYPTEIKAAKIELVLIYPEISKKIIARAVRSNRELKFFSGFDYLIEFSGDIWERLNDKTKEIVMLHELKHLYPYEKKGQAGENSFPEYHQCRPGRLHQFLCQRNEQLADSPPQ